MKRGKGRREIDALLDFWGNTWSNTFGEEEKLMEELDCPAAAVNKQAHAQFLLKYGGLRKRLDAAGTGPALVLEMYEMLSKWLVEHIQGVDIQLRGASARRNQNLVGASN